MSLLKRDFDTRRELPTALAHMLAATKLSDQGRQAWLGRIFRTLSPVDQFKVRWELAECRAAKRGERLAQVAP